MSTEIEKSGDLESVIVSEVGSAPESALPFVLPFVAVMLLATLAPSFELAAYATEPGQLGDGWAPYKYMGVVGFQLAVAIGLLVWFHKTYLRHFRLRFSIWGVLVGLVGGVLWIWVCSWGVEKAVLPTLGLKSLVEVRPAFDPFLLLPDELVRWTFLILRFGMLVVAIPIIEELFLRGWFIRWIQNPNWASVSLAEIGRKGLLAVIAYAVLTHPSEALAAVLWFGLINGLMVRTGNFWDCVMAHAITNLMLGLYVVNYGRWELW